jgi:hypothetical protein
MICPFGSSDVFFTNLTVKAKSKAKKPRRSGASKAGGAGGRNSKK